MTPFFEPIVAELGPTAGLTTDDFVKRNGPIVARGISEGRHQFVVFRNGSVYSSMHTWGSWFPWHKVPTHSVHRYAKMLKARMEYADL